MQPLTYPMSRVFEISAAKSLLSGKVLICGFCNHKNPIIRLDTARRCESCQGELTGPETKCGICEKSLKFARNLDLSLEFDCPECEAHYQLLWNSGELREIASYQSRRKKSRGKKNASHKRVLRKVICPNENCGTENSIIGRTKHLALYCKDCGWLLGIQSICPNCRKSIGLGLLDGNIQEVPFNCWNCDSVFSTAQEQSRRQTMSETTADQHVYGCTNCDNTFLAQPPTGDSETVTCTYCGQPAQDCGTAEPKMVRYQSHGAELAGRLGTHRRDQSTDIGPAVVALEQIGAEILRNRESEET